MPPEPLVFVSGEPSQVVLSFPAFACVLHLMTSPCAIGVAIRVAVVDCRASARLRVSEVLAAMGVVRIGVMILVTFGRFGALSSFCRSSVSCVARSHVVSSSRPRRPEAPETLNPQSPNPNDLLPLNLSRTP